MALQYSVAVRNAQLDAVETAVGATPSLEIRTGAPPANCAAADGGSVLATIVLPSDWMNAASAGAKTKLGTWSVAASGAGTAAHWRLKQGGTCHAQGTCTGTGGGGDMELDNTSIVSPQAVTVNTFTLNRGNA